MKGGMAGDILFVGLTTNSESYEFTDDEASYGQTNKTFLTANRKGEDMRNLCIFVAVTLLSSIGWWLGSRFGVFIAFLLSSVGSLAGVYVGWRIYRDYLS